MNRRLKASLKLHTLSPSEKKWTFSYTYLLRYCFQSYEGWLPRDRQSLKYPSCIAHTEQDNR